MKKHLLALKKKHSKRQFKYGNWAAATAIARCAPHLLGPYGSPLLRRYPFIAPALPKQANALPHISARWLGAANIDDGVSGTDACVSTTDDGVS